MVASAATGEFKQILPEFLPDTGALAWQVGTPTPGGRAFRAAVDLARYPSLSAEPVRIQADRPAGVDELRFTLDGAVPTAAAPRLDAPIRLPGPTALRVRGFAGGVPVTPVATRQLWIGPLPPAPTLMLALDHALIDDPEIGVQPNDWWRRQQKLPDDPAFGPLRLVRRRHWARERRQWIKPVHLMVVDAKGLAFEGRARLRRFGTAAGDGFPTDTVRVRSEQYPSKTPPKSSTTRSPACKARSPAR